MRLIIRAHRSKGAAMVVSEFVIGITMIGTDDAGNASVASRGTISLNFNSMSQTARDVPAGGEVYG
jgi:hypothetical protein